MRTLSLKMVAVILGAAAGLTACGNGVVGDNQAECVGPGCSVSNSQQDPSFPTTGPASQPGIQDLTDCVSDSDCVAPYLCNLNVNKCVPPEAKDSGPCDPIEGNDCSDGLQCIAGLCMPPPGACSANDDCPVGFLCQNGTCVLDGGGGDACRSTLDCPGGMICLNGQCTTEEACNIPHNTNRLQGTWVFDSKLHVRDGLEGLTAGILDIASTMQDLIEGEFEIDGIPSVITDLAADALADLIKDYVPAWGQQLISYLAQINDVIDDTRIISLESLQAVGGDQYVGSSTWTMIEFEYQGAVVQSTPENIPGLGAVEVDGYTAREFCGALYIDKHAIENGIGHIFRWAVEAVITAMSCTRSDMSCYNDLRTMLGDLIDCRSLAYAIAKSSSYLDDYQSLIEGACNSQKDNLIDLVYEELDQLALSMTYMKLGGLAEITAGGLLDQGKWYGVLGGGFGKGNFEGTFTAVRQ